MHFLVFIPDCKPAEIEQAAKVAGLTPILGGHDVLPHVAGPNDLTGVMIGHLSPQAPLMNYSPASQTWLPSVCKDESGRSRYWVGIWKDKPPVEAELRRSYTQDGILFQLGPVPPDEPLPGCPPIPAQHWKIPSTKSVDSRAVYNDDGTMRWEPLRRFSWLVDEAAQMQAAYIEHGLQTRSFQFANEPSPQIEWIIRLLQINYRILPEVAVYLDLFSGSKESMMDLILFTLQLARKGVNDV